MGVTLKDLLPGLIGAGVGAISPKAGKAGVQTLEMADAFGQRRRRQGMEDERMEMSRAAAGRSEEAAGRAGKSFEWGKENFAHQSRVRADMDNEKALAKNAGASIMRGYEEAGTEIPEGLKAGMAGADTRAEVSQFAEKIKKFISDTPMSIEAADKYALTLGPGEVAYANVRTEDGQIVRQALRNPNHPTGSGTLSGLGTVTSAADTFMKAQEDAALASQKLGSIESTHRMETLEDLPTGGEMRAMPSTEVARAGEGAVRAPRYTSPEQRASEANAQLNVQQAFRSLIMKGVPYPEALKQILPMVMGQSGGLPQQGTMPKEQVVDGPSSTPGAAGIAYSQGF